MKSGLGTDHGLANNDDPDIHMHFKYIYTHAHLHQIGYPPLFYIYIVRSFHL